MEEEENMLDIDDENQDLLVFLEIVYQRVEEAL